METQEYAPPTIQELAQSTALVLLNMHLWRAANSAVAGNPLGTDLHLLWEN